VISGERAESPPVDDKRNSSAALNRFRQLSHAMRQFKPHAAQAYNIPCLLPSDHSSDYS
jgi:hypothetical protein